MSKAKNRWYYIWVCVDLFNRRIINPCAGTKKDAVLVTRPFDSVHEICVKFSYSIRIGVVNSRTSLSIRPVVRSKSFVKHGGWPDDNAVAEAAFLGNENSSITSKSLHHLELCPYDHIWLVEQTKHSIHRTSGYMSPVDYRN